jgi:deoxyribonuclease-1
LVFHRDGHQGTTPSGSVIANRNGRGYHRPECRGVAMMEAANKVVFGSAAEAERAGYRKAGDCR